MIVWHRLIELQVIQRFLIRSGRIFAGMFCLVFKPYAIQEAIHSVARKPAVSFWGAFSVTDLPATLR